ncbi:MAG: sulfotransferase [Xanthobacteraceae bacterium]|nr:sulfotransferase [Xanthobacteraceae bacterium]
MPEHRPIPSIRAPAAAAETADPLRDAATQVHLAEELRQQKKFDRARKLCETLLARYPGYYAAQFTLGLIFIDRQQYSLALDALVRALMFEPQSWQALNALGAVYMKLGAHEMAAQTLERAARIKPDEPTVLIALGEVYRDELDFERAREAFRKAYALDDSIAVAGLGLGRCCAALGFYEEAAQVLERLMERGMGSISVLGELAELPRQVVSVDVEAALARIPRPAGENQASFASIAAFVRAAALDRRGRHREAWEQLVEANRGERDARQQEAAAMAHMEQQNLAQLRPRRLTVAGDASGPKSLFILGASRSGKTTVEALVSTLPGIKPGYENPIVENAVRRTFLAAGLPPARRFEMLPLPLDEQCRAFYRQDLARRAGPARVFTNTSPALIHDVARIAAAFPGARFLFIKRDVDDTMFRIFSRLYLAGNAYSYDLRAIRKHVAWYHEMIDMFAGKLPEVARVVAYEDVVSDPAAVVSQAAALCGLPVPSEPPPHVADDRGCSHPYRQWIAAALG